VREVEASVYVVIMAGGGGTRLWPLSRRDRPKPFLPLLDGGSLLQATVARLAPMVEPRDVYLVTDARYATLIEEQLPDVPRENVIGEPVGRNTAAAVALAAAAIDRPADDVMVVLPADHQIADESGFRAALAEAARAANEGSLVTLGITPTGPETGYGYVVASPDPASAAAAGGARTSTALRVERFEEKPLAERAQELIATGRAFWNAGIFVWRRDLLLDSLQRFAADIISPIREAISSGADLADTYAELRSAPVDRALMEPASLEKLVAVVPASIGWSDLGSWAAILDALEGTASDASAGVSGNTPGLIAPLSTHQDVGSRDSLVVAQGNRLVATVGLHDVIVVDTPDALLVVAKDAAQDVKQIVDRLTVEKREDLL
jgi:mannose-1-phosphate guanylyltransferase